MRTIEPNPDTEPMYAAVADYKRKFGLVETLSKLQMMTEATKDMVEDQYRSPAGAWRTPNHLPELFTEEESHPMMPADPFRSPSEPSPLAHLKT